jgi:hypothetical protein
MNIINKIKSEIKDIKDVTVAKMNVQRRLIHFEKIVGQFNGLNIVLYDEAVLAFTGCKCISGLTVNNKIYINQAAMDAGLNSPLVLALLAHEAAHIELGHLTQIAAAGQTKYGIQAALGFGLGLRVELEADRHAADQGYDVLGLLKHTQGSINSRAIRKRINALLDN